MKISKFETKNFRNLDNLELELNPNINIFIGDNAQGKTNILESIYTLALTKSYKNNLDVDLIKYNNDFLKVKADIIIKNKKIKYEIVITATDKKLKINDIVSTKICDYVSNINIILFTPDHLDIIKKSPQNRRNLLNTDLCQLDKKYLIVLNEYNKILKMRNDYLRKENNIDNLYLDILTDKLIDKSLIIYEYRSEFINLINKYLSSLFKKITKQEDLKIVYEKSINLKNKEEYKCFYKLNFEKEKFQKMTLYGPHRDDFSFYIGDIDMKRFASQGFQRIAVLALKLSEINVFKEKTGEYPIVLLDDIFSELDLKKRNMLLKLIKSNIQYIITTTDLNNIDKKILENSDVFYIKEGYITRKAGKIDGKRKRKRN